MKLYVVTNKDMSLITNVEAGAYGYDGVGKEVKVIDIPDSTVLEEALYNEFSSITIKVGDIKRIRSFGACVCYISTGVTEAFFYYDNALRAKSAFDLVAERLIDISEISTGSKL